MTNGSDGVAGASSHHQPGEVAAPPAVTAQAEPLLPTEADEDSHPADSEPLWAESWYADFADPAGGFGGWLRLGLIPNQDVTWLHALLCGPDMPTIAITDTTGPVSATPWELTGSDLEFSHTVAVPLHTYRMTVRGRAEAFDDPAALLRGEAGREVELRMDLTWTTAGTPYRYRFTTRYEIPCVVSGSVVADGHAYELNAVAGQRDHSWGARDWWAMDWVWSALHLDSGDHIHAVEIRIPGMARMSIGYLQTPGLPMRELDAISARETIDATGLPVEAELTFEPGGLGATIDVRGHAPVRVISADGRVSHFPRAWALITTNDGRTGVGWIEWNRHRAAEPAS